MRPTPTSSTPAAAPAPCAPRVAGPSAPPGSWPCPHRPSPVNAWTHVALTYDGSTLRLFVNGTQVATRASTGTLQATTNPLSIGGNQSRSASTSTGLIDEVRVYNRSLSQTDIQADMSTRHRARRSRHDPAVGAHGSVRHRGSRDPVILTWTASTDNVGVSGYRVERCQGAGCTDFAQVGTPSRDRRSRTPAWPASTTYRYQVRAVDAAGNLSPYSSIATATTPAAGDTTAPSAPTAPSATAISTSRIDLGWTASTDNVGVTGYRVERCQGAACTDFAQVGTPSATSFSDIGVAASTTYRYRVRAARRGRQPQRLSRRSHGDDPGRPPTPRRRRRPRRLSATAISATRIDLGWTASTDNVGVTGYRVERCRERPAPTSPRSVRRPRRRSATRDWRPRRPIATACARSTPPATSATTPRSHRATTPAAPDTTAPSTPTGSPPPRSARPRST